MTEKESTIPTMEELNHRITELNMRRVNGGPDSASGRGCDRMIISSRNLTEVYIKTTPQQLRDIADKMQAQYDNAKTGDSIDVAVFDTCEYPIRVHIRYDQQAMLEH